MEILFQSQTSLLVETAAKLVRTTPIAVFGSTQMAQKHARNLTEPAGRTVLRLAV